MQNTSPEYAQALENKVQEMQEAAARQDRGAYVRNDFEIHRLIWSQANNPYLLEVLRTLTGPITMFIADNASHFSWEETLELHETLIDCINSGDVGAALEAIDRHLDHGLRRSSQVFGNGEPI
jgi:DNA-binding GntR family transcriptional regulator